MTRTEKVFLLISAVFFVAALFLLPARSAVRLAEESFTRPGPTPLPAEEAQVIITLETRIDLNTASARELTALPGVGNSLAAAIVAYREEHGPFASVQELLRVDGFNEATLSALYAAMGDTGP